MKKIVTSATVAALALTTVVAPQAMAEYKESYESGTCTIEIKQADKDAINAYLASPTDSANNLAETLQKILFEKYPEQKANVETLEKYHAKAKADPLLALAPRGPRREVMKAIQDLNPEIDGVTLSFKRNDLRWFIKGPETTPEPVEFPAKSLTIEEVNAALESGDVEKIFPENAKLKEKIDKHYKEETGDLDNIFIGGAYSDSVKAVSEMLKDNAEKERDRASKALGTHSLKTALENCQYLSQGKDPEDERQTGSSQDLEILRPIAYAFAGLTGLFAILGIAYGWVREHMPQLLGM